MTEIVTGTPVGTCAAYENFRPQAGGPLVMAVCDRSDGHLDTHLDRATGHAWTSTRWSRRVTSADGRYLVYVYENTEPTYESWEMNPDHYDADDETIAKYESERARMLARFGSPLTRFADGTRLYVGGTGWDALVGHDAPDDDNDQVAWDSYYAHELNAIATAITVASRTLDGRGVELPPSVNDYMRSIHAGCMGCPCSPGMVCKDAVKGPNGRTVTVDVTVRSDAEIAEAYGTRGPAESAPERGYITLPQPEMHDVDMVIDEQ